MTYATTFSGIGGWELGLNACGWELKWQCEANPFCREYLSRTYGVPVYPDIRTICGERPAPVDALIGSPPCQPFSVAGRQSGVCDERHLYPAFVELVAQIKPRWVLMEQVPNIIAIGDGAAWGEYLSGIARLGYDIVTHPIPACAVGANHRRVRLWIVAHATGQHSEMRIQHRRNPQAGKGNFNESFRCQDSFQPSFVAADAEILQAWNSQLPEPCLVTMDDGIPDTREWIEAYGNAVVPQIPYLIGQAINQTLSQPLNQSEK
jgi:DNA (cytosine-5)-methyltransferase 1